jgi:hypothetical protein
MPPVIASLACHRKALFLLMTFVSYFGSHECLAPNLAFGPTLGLMDSSRPCIRLHIFLLRVPVELVKAAPFVSFFFIW